MGGLICGIYTAGKLDMYARWVSALQRLLDLSLDGRGLFKGDRIMGVARDLIGDRDIEDLPLSFTAVATDLQSGRKV